MDIVTQIFGFILSLSLIVILHEFGHFGFARLFKTRVEKFYLFFDPWFSLFKFKKDDTEYGIGWLPLGGYVKISGMIDESMDKEALKEPPKSYEFRSKPAWQRLLIMVGGVLVNFILALGIYSMILFTWGKEYIPVQNGTDGVVWDTLGLDIGLMHGDIPLRADTMHIEQFFDIVSHLLVDEAKTITVLRDGREKTIDIPEDFSQEMLARGVKSSSFAGFRFPFFADSILANSPAESAGILKGDKLISLNDELIPSFYEFSFIVGRMANEKVKVGVLRNNREIYFDATVGDDGKLGIAPIVPTEFYETKKINYNFLESIPAGVSYGVDVLVGYVKQMKLIFSKEGAKQLGGFGLMGSLFPKSWDWQVFWQVTALLSIILAFFNILPIPALDGGHVAFLLYEMVTGRKPGDKFLEIAQIVGMVLLLSLVVYANLNDILRYLGIEMF